MTDENNEEVYGLVMPYVVCEEYGGPYDAESFVAGVRFGQWQSLLKLLPTMHTTYEPEALVPQLDLLAMDAGYHIRTEPWDVDPHWVKVTMSAAPFPEENNNADE